MSQPGFTALYTIYQHTNTAYSSSVLSVSNLLHFSTAAVKLEYEVDRLHAHAHTHSHTNAHSKFSSYSRPPHPTTHTHTHTCIIADAAW